MTDIVERLRTEAGVTYPEGRYLAEIMDEAADEIELLRTALRGAATVVRASADEIERLRAQMESGNYLTENDKLSLGIERQALEIKERDDEIMRLRAALRNVRPA